MMKRPRFLDGAFFAKKEICISINLNEKWNENAGFIPM